MKKQKENVLKELFGKGKSLKKSGKSADEILKEFRKDFLVSKWID